VLRGQGRGGRHATARLHQQRRLQRVQSSPLLNRCRLPSSHEIYKPAQGCHGAVLSRGSPKPTPSANAFAEQGPASTSCSRLLGGGEDVQCTRSQQSLISGAALPWQGQAPAGLRAGTVPPVPGTPSPQGHGQTEGGFGGVGTAGTGQPRHAPSPARRQATSPSPHGCWHMLAGGQHATVGTLPATNTDTGLPHSATSRPPAPPRDISEPRGLPHLRTGRRRWPATQQTACREPARSVPRPQPHAGDRRTRSSKPGRGLGQEGHLPGIFHWTADSAEVPEQVQFPTTKRLLTLERLMWERDPSPSQSSLCWRHQVETLIIHLLERCLSITA